MNFDEFVKEMVASIKTYLPEWYDEAKYEIVDMQKLNENYTGLRVTLPDENVAPCINMNAAYEAYMNGMDMKDILEKTADIISMPNPQVDVSSLLDYESVKDRLFVRVSNAEKNQDVLAELPHTMMDDFAMTYHVMCGRADDGVASMPVNNGLMKKYGVTLEQLHEDAMKSSPEVLPVKTEPIVNILRAEMRRDMERHGFDEEDIQMALSQFDAPEIGLHVVTNEVGTNGASAIFYPGVMDELAEKMGGNFYVLPSSTDEVLILPNDGEMSVAQLSAMVQEVNETQVSEEMRLGNEAYHYDAADKVFEKASAHAERMVQKESEKETSSEKKSIMKKMDEKKKEIGSAVKDAVTPKRTPEVAL